MLPGCCQFLLPAVSYRELLPARSASFPDHLIWVQEGKDVAMVGQHGAPQKDPSGAMTPVGSAVAAVRTALLTSSLCPIVLPFNDIIKNIYLVLVQIFRDRCAFGYF